MTIYLYLAGIILVFLVLLPAVGTKSWKRSIEAIILSFVGILVPLFIFVSTTCLVPECKGECHNGWIDCFIVGKVMLTPLLLWSCAAFYVAQIVRPQERFKTWVALGLFTGAIVSIICLVFVIVTKLWAWWFIVPPLYIAIWYSVLSICAFQASGLTPLPYIITLIGSAPFWLASAFLSKNIYLLLPENCPECFVVTAAVRGHEVIVGPLFNVTRRGMPRIANQQLQTFWLFEVLWQNRFPTSHRLFRRYYNQMGPIIASQIKTKFVADIVYMLIKPFEVLATILVSINGLYQMEKS
ncbi:hypothetical protein K8T06_12705 [bacterium]|nr:hypothetical protein [bacterium]